MDAPKDERTYIYVFYLTPLFQCPVVECLARGVRIEHFTLAYRRLCALERLYERSELVLSNFLFLFSPPVVVFAAKGNSVKGEGLCGAGKQAFIVWQSR